MDEDDSIIDDSDYDDESMEILTDNEERSIGNVISESDDATSSGRNSLIPSVASIASAASSTEDGRLTPLIRKAIRRSIHKIAKESSDEEEDEEEEEEGDENDSRQEHDSDHENPADSSDDEPIKTKNHKKRIVIEDDSSEEEGAIEEFESPKEHNSKNEHKGGQNKSSKSNHRKQYIESDSSEDEVISSHEQSRQSNTKSKTPNTHNSKKKQHRTESHNSSNSDYDGHNIENDSSEEEVISNHEQSRHSLKEFESPDTHNSMKKQHSAESNKSSKGNYRRVVIESSDDEFISSHEESRVSVEKSVGPVEKPVQRRPRDKDYVVESDYDEGDSHDETNSDSDHSRNSPEIQLLDVPKKQAPIVDILDSDEDKENNPSNSLETSMAISMAREEIMNTTIDPVMAQKRALLVYKQQQIETQLAKAKMILKSGNMNLLPDKGERLRQSISNDEKKLAEVIREIKNIHLQETDFNAPKVKIEKPAPLFKQDSLEVDPTYLKPTTDDIKKELGKKAQETLQREQSLTVDRLKDLHGSLLARPADDERAQDPRGLKISLMPHQQHALAWLLWRERQKPPGGVLADDMGLGKTLTMISLVMASIAKNEAGEGSDDEDDWQSSARAQKHLGGTLVVAPASLLAQWQAEVNNRCKRGLLSVELYHGNNRESVPKRLAKTDIVVTTYNILSREFKMNGVLYKIRWRRVILDEAHVIRNHKSQTCEAVCGVHANKRWALTGTPVHNKEMDLYSILKFLQCSPFDDLRVWKRWVDNKNAAGHERLATVMKSLMLRRTKAELQAKGELEMMPDKHIEIIEVALDPEERLVYDKVMVFSRTIFAQFLAQRAEKNHMFEMGAGKFDKPSWQTTSRDTQFTKAQNKLLSLHADVKSHEILVLLLRLRQVCCHPPLIHSMLDQEDIENTGLEENGTDIDLLSKMGKMNLEEENEEGDIGVDKRVSEHLLTSDNPVFDPKRQCSKMRAVLEKVEEILAKGDKMIIVSQWTGLLNVVADELNNIKEASYRMFTGQVAVKDRQGIMDEFNSRSAKPNVLLLSLTAGGVGLNLVGANHLLLMDIHWNPQLESQAQDRIYRFGQKKDVFIYKYICTDTIEERIKGLQDRKLELASAVLSGGGKVVGSKLSLDDIKSLFSL